MKPVRPLGERLLAALVGDPALDEILGDLREEALRAERAGQSRLATRLWFAVQLCDVGAHAAWAKLRSPMPDARETRIALRRLRRDPAFSAVVILALALGVGVNVLILSVANGVLFRPLPYPAAERLAYLSARHEGAPLGGNGVSLLNLEDVRARSTALEDLTLFLDWQDVYYTGSESAYRIPASFVDRRYFEMLGLDTHMGRLFSAGENGLDGFRRVAVLGRGTWEGVFGADPGVVGLVIQLNGRPYEVVGVLSDDRGDLRYTHGRDAAGIFLPLMALEDHSGIRLRQGRAARFLGGVVKARPGVRLSEAQGDVRAVASALASEHPEENGGWTYDFEPLDEAFFRGFQTPAAILLVGSALVLVLMTVNLITLVTIRAIGHERDTAVRLALGAGGGRIVRDLITEGTALSATGGGLGIALAASALGLLAKSRALNLPAFAELQLDASGVLVGVALSLGLGLALGLAPAAVSLRSLNGAVPAGGRHSATRRHGRRRGLLIAAEIAMAFLLLTGAGWMLTSFRTLRGTPYGFTTDDLLTAKIDLRGERYRSADATRAAARDLIDRGAAIPGVWEAFIWSPNRLGGGDGRTGLMVTRGGRLSEHPEERIEAGMHGLHAGTLAKAGIRLVRGRDVTPADDENAPRVVLVSESLARRLWPSGDALGRSVDLDLGSQQTTAEIVGVVADVRHRTRLVDPFGPQLDVYHPFRQRPSRTMHLALRMDPDAPPEEIATAVRAFAVEVVPGVPAYDVRTMESRARDEESKSRLTAIMVGVYAVLALTLAALGVYGVLGHSVRQRVREIGIRLALGANPRAVTARVMGNGMAIAALGTAAGFAGVLLAVRFVSAALYGVDPYSPPMFIGVAAVLGTVALFACALPAWRAARIDPVIALRGE